MSGVVIGGLVFSKQRLAKLPADLRKLLLATAAEAAKNLNKRVRDEDQKAFELLKTKMTVVSPSLREKNRWDARFKEVRERLGQSVFPATLVSKLESLAGK